ncbi:MAG: NADPH-dependent 7-cyano-7-deazaguanine reductase QueF [Planctomycetes bacterium]|nr:NADPH-dependent 7-cyano-7-deazaguanine reductase QueF [Planctomycetota bacterium]MBI3846305.1 NADPH-dependent 7-cyano-7-deazaguanine reductase QueF [Planctomycetota bacterium]
MGTRLSRRSRRVIEHDSTPESAMRLHPLDVFEYAYRGEAEEIHFTCPEFTAICPFSDFPDFGTIRITYVPDRYCIELKSLKLYVNSFRSVRIFHEHAVRKILNDFVAACAPRSVEIEGDFNVRGNIKTVVKASHRQGRASANDGR